MQVRSLTSEMRVAQLLDKYYLVSYEGEKSCAFCDEYYPRMMVAACGCEFCSRCFYQELPSIPLARCMRCSLQENFQMQQQNITLRGGSADGGAVPMGVE